MVNGLNVQFRAVGTRSLWQVIKTGIVINDFFIPFENVDYITVSSSPKLLGNGIVRFKEKGRDQEIHLLYSSPFSEMVQEAVYEANYQINELNGKQQAIDHLCSSTGTLLEVFDEYLLIKHMGTNLGLLFSDQSAGIKRIDYDQLTAIQYKKPGSTVWSTKGDKNSTVSSAELKPGKSGTYTVRCIVKDSKGAVSTKNFSLTVNTAPALVNSSTISASSVKLFMD